MHELYNTERYPVFICNHGPWDIYKSATSDNLASIPTPEAAKSGHKPSHFGDMAYLRYMARLYPERYHLSQSIAA
jgi:hypothetical protein